MPLVLDSPQRAWRATLRDAGHGGSVNLDDSVKVPETILAEQLLTNANITNDQRLMVRAMLQGTGWLKMPNVACTLPGTLPGALPGTSPSGAHKMVRARSSLPTGNLLRHAFPPWWWPCKAACPLPDKAVGAIAAARL